MERNKNGLLSKKEKEWALAANPCAYKKVVYPDGIEDIIPISVCYLGCRYHDYYWRELLEIVEISNDTVWVEEAMK